MESDSSAKSLLNLFSSSNLKSFAPATSRTFYTTSAPGASKGEEDDGAPTEQPKKRRRLSGNTGEWSPAEMRALETYRSISERDSVGGELRDILLPNRTEQEINVQLRKLKDHSWKSKRTKLQELEKEESEELEKANERRKKNLDDLLDRGNEVGDAGPTVSAQEEGKDRKEEHTEEKRDVAAVRASLDQVLGLAPETEEQKRKRALDEALGLTWG
jgi:hypothetical protein